MGFTLNRCNFQGTAEELLTGWYAEVISLGKTKVEQ